MTVSIKTSILPGRKIVLQRTDVPPVLTLSGLLSEQARNTHINIVGIECTGFPAVL